MQAGATSSLEALLFPRSSGDWDGALALGDPRRAHLCKPTQRVTFTFIRHGHTQGEISSAGRAGTNIRFFQGTSKERHKLKQGSYRLVITATSVGGPSSRRSISFYDRALATDVSRGPHLGLR